MVASARKQIGTDRLAEVATILARNCCGVQVFGVTGIEPRDVQRIAQEFLERRREAAIAAGEDVRPVTLLECLARAFWATLVAGVLISASVMFLVLTSLSIRAVFLD
jgi:hypothetical protein